MKTLLLAVLLSTMAQAEEHCVCKILTVGRNTGGGPVVGVKETFPLPFPCEQTGPNFPSWLEAVRMIEQTYGCQPGNCHSQNVACDNLGR